MSSTSLSWTCKVGKSREALRTIDLPIFLCPAFLGPQYRCRRHQSRLGSFLRSTSLPVEQRSFNTSSDPLSKTSHHQLVQKVIRLPQQCPGCGAFSQTLDGEGPGYYCLSRKNVKTYLAGGVEIFARKMSSENQIVGQSQQKVDVQVSVPPICDRCHKLLHHHNGVPISHPTIESIHDTILESPHKFNHVYHIIDAADFPMSLVPQIHKLLNLTPQRSLNRRSKPEKFYHGRKNEVSFIVTRSDLLAPLKSQVDSLMPYLISVLRDALGSAGKDMRLGNVKCVSAKRGWWTKELKEEIWDKGGGGWMVGKVNVGKSQLFDSVFPKGRRGIVKSDESPATGIVQELSPTAGLELPKTITQRETSLDCLRLDQITQEAEPYDKFSLLPPLQPEVNYPAMPLVSALPGTTASPIRVQFGNDKGELVDLPGLSRGDLELFVQECRRSSLVMQSRIVPAQHIIKPGKSMLLGGFIRITPTTPDVIILAYAFTPISSHLTSTAKAISIQLQDRESGVENIANPGVGKTTQLAGRFSLKWDVTKQRSGPITSPSAVGIKVDKLPYRVLSTDILIEGCGWIELVAQVRKKTMESESFLNHIENEDPIWPEVEVYSPNGRFIAARRPLGAWVLGGPKRRPTGTKRIRKSMKGIKKKIKALKRNV